MKYQFLIIAFVILFSVFFLTDYALAGSATLSWSANTESDLAGYKIYYGLSSRNNNCPPGGYSEKININKPALSEKPTYTFENLEEGRTYYFSITSYDTSGNESCFSEEINKTIPKTSKSLSILIA